MAFSQEAVLALEKIRKSRVVPMSTNADVVRNAVRLLSWYLRIREEGSRLQIVKPDGSVKELEFIF